MQNNIISTSLYWLSRAPFQYNSYVLLWLCNQRKGGHSCI